MAALAVALAAGPGALSAQITVDNSSSATVSAGTLSWLHTVGSGSGRFLVVGVSIRNASNTVQGVTVNSAALTFIGARNNSDNAVRTEMWYRAAPAVGVDTIKVTLTGAAKMVGGAVSFFGVSAGAPLGTFVADSSNGTGTTDPSVVVPSAANEVIVSALSAQGSAGTVTPLGGQTQQWNLFFGTAGGDAAGFGSTAPGAASVTMGWTKTGTAKWAIGAVSLKPGATTTLGNGTDPGNASLAPGGAATMADAFTFQTSSGTDAVTAVGVTLAAGTAGGLGLVEITNDAGTTVYGSVANPASDTPAITLTTNITATTTLTQYKIRVTPKSHAAMPVPPGSSYAVTARITGWTSGNNQVGSDAAGTTVTIDNLSPGDVTAANAIAGSAQVLLDWTNPGDADLGTIIVLRRATSAVADVPVEGATYVVGNTIGASTVACVVTAPAATCTDTGLSNGTSYNYKIFTRDVNGNYSLGVVPTGSPATPGQQTISSAADQTFVIGASSTPASAITVSDNNGKFKPGNDVYFVIPAALSMVWDNAVGTVTITGNAAAKVSTTPTYTSGSCVKITVLSNFTAGDQIIVAGLALKSFSAIGGPASLTLGLKACNSTVATDDKTKTIVAPPTLSGTVFEDVNYGGGAGRSAASSSGVGRSGARVELYTSAGVYSTFTTTDASGNYSFPGLAPGTYYVRVVNSSVTSSRTGYTSSALAVQTYRTDASSGTAVAVTDYVGGTNPSAADPGNGSTGATFSTITFVYSAVLSGAAQSVTKAVITSADITGLDFGFNFNTVVNANNTGQGSLRQFIDNANLLGGDASLAQVGLIAAKDNAVFMISNGTAAAGLRSANNYFSGGIATIAPNPGLPTVSTPMVIDAQKQPGWSSPPIIELNGSGAGASQNGLTVTGGGTIVRGFVVNRFTNHGIYLLTAGGDTVQGNYVGLNSAGTAASANTVHGIFANNIASNLIGGTTASARNVVSGNAYGIVIAGASATGNTVSGNYVGLNAAGTAAIANSIGIDVEGAATGNAIGGTTSSARNIVSGNTQMGVLLQNAGTTGNTVAGNYIGTNAAGSAAVANGTYGVNIKNNASGNTVGGTTGTAGNVISGNTGSGIAIEGAAASGNIVQGNYVGLNPAGTAAIANVSHGIYLNGAPSNTIGGTTAAARNIFSGNSGNGVYLLGAAASGNLIRGNYIGTNAAGTAAVANAANGVLLEVAANDTIGGTAAGAGNVISGNTGHGLWFYSSTTGSVAQGNYIGTNAAGSAAIPNGVHGVVISAGSSSNTVGGTSAAARNVISGNAIAGVRLAPGGSGTTGNTIQGNYIGVDVAGTGALGNGSFGVIVDAVNTTVGGTAAGAGNLIANNGADGVAVVNASTGNAIERNAVYSNGGLGIDLADDGVTANNGTKNSALPNSDMDSPVFTSAVLSGTTLTVAGYVGSAASQGTFAAARVEIFKSAPDPTGYGEGQSYLGFLTADANGNFSGALTVSGVSSGDKITATATDAGGNTSEFGANYTAGSYTLSGTVFEDVNYGGGAGRSKAASSGATCAGDRVELYTSTGAYSSFTTTDGTGNYSFTGLAAGTYYIRVVNSSVTSSRSGCAGSAVAVQTYRTDATSGTAVAVTDYVGGTDPAALDPGNGSTGATFNTTTFVYSAVLSGTAQSVTKVVITSADIAGLDFGFNFNTVVNVNTTGQGSLRQFITNANLLSNAGLTQSGRTAGIDNAIWMISNGTAAAGLRSANNYFSGGVATIAPAPALPVIADPVILDAQTQPGWSSAPIVQLSGTGAGAGARGLDLEAGGSTVRGFVINGFTGNSNSAGIWIGTAGSNTIQGNYIGTNAAGTAALANYQGMYVTTSSNTIGGSAATQRNVLSGNTWRAILVDNSGGGAASNVIRGNYVGIDATGTTAIANNIGIYLFQSPNNVIGGTGAGEGNVASGNTNFGIYLVNSGANGNLVQGNTIGLNASRSGSVPNGASGIEFCCTGNGGTGNTIGGTAAAAANVVSGNTGRGILMRGGTGNGILGNSIYGNGGIGIDLGADNVTANDGAKPAGQPNLLMDFPVFTSALLSGTTLTVTGYIGSAAGQSLFGSARVEIFKSDLDPSGNGEGQTYLGFLTADASGNISGSLTGVSGLSVGDKITGTATDGSNNTSEFGANVAVAAPAPSMTLAESVTPSGTLPPGTDLAYTTTFTNAGTSAAQSVVITDPIPANTDFKVGSVTQNLGSTGLTVAIAYSSDGGSTWSYTPASGAGGAPAGYDRLVTHVRWTFTGNLSQTAPNNSGSTGVTMRIR